MIVFLARAEYMQLLKHICWLSKKSKKRPICYLNIRPLIPGYSSFTANLYKIEKQSSWTGKFWTTKACGMPYFSAFDCHLVFVYARFYDYENCRSPFPLRSPGSTSLSVYSYSISIAQLWFCIADMDNPVGSRLMAMKTTLQQFIPVHSDRRSLPLYFPWIPLSETDQWRRIIRTLLRPHQPSLTERYSWIMRCIPGSMLIIATDWWKFISVQSDKYTAWYVDRRRMALRPQKLQHQQAVSCKTKR